MAKECPSGCGSCWNDRSIELADYLEAHSLPIQETSSQPADELESFIDSGRSFEEALIAVVHGEDARIVDRGQLNMWIKTAMQIRRSTASALG